MAKWPLFIISTILLLALLGDRARQWLQFDRSEIAAGEVWRIFTCHWVHLGWTHTILNSLGIIFVAWLYPKGKWTWWMAFWLFSSVLVTVGVWLDLRIETYVGASGVLHGALILGVWNSRWLENWRKYSLLIILLGKLIWEQTRWYNDADLAEVIGGHVVVNSHFFGGVAALIVMLFISLYNKRKISSSMS